MTSIEWLREELVNNENIRWRGTNINALIEQAKEMHRNEIEDKFNKGWMSGYDRCLFDSKDIQDSDMKEDCENSSGFYQKTKKD